MHRDYGVSWDEPTDHLNGLVNVKYIAMLLTPERVQQEPSAHLIPDFTDYRDNDHGVLFEVPVALLSYLFTHHNSPAYYFLRHLLIFSTFVAGVWAIYRIGKYWLRDWRWGLLAAALLVLSPRLFADAFFNGKDIVFMACFTVAVWTLIRLLNHPTSKGRATWHGLATAVALDVRLLGSIVVLYTLFLLLLEASASTPTTRHSVARSGGIYLIATAVGTVVGWPYLWANPISHFVAAFHNLSHYPWTFTNLYFGYFLKADALPWHYALVWIGITTPVAYSLLAVVGVGSTVRQLFPTSLRSFGTRSFQLNGLLLGWLIGPLLIIILLKSALYDTWRHLYFVYPALILFAVRGIALLAQWAIQWQTRLRYVAQALLFVAGLETIYTAIRMVRLHPYEHLYYSFLPSATVERLFERDYWGLSFRQGLEWLLAHDASPGLRVRVKWPFNNPLYNNLLILPAQDRARVLYTPQPTQARYFITTYRWHPQTYADSLGKEIYSIRAEGIKILSIFDREAASSTKAR
ncbi:hypothetical protein [Hymenobacter profundi]|uniref:Glycosyltransferase RgtA/B/C/D-like domain-containing protein n=1 Tax=Hymenobacter profundi TaxID=1982110 RepID=A0ABS6X3N8_9BACT|nr:hypothetical protein [Hymenobacter profundi]MBW3130452.1 hypothetical protein [Hymenobacter profundi]